MASEADVLRKAKEQEFLLKICKWEGKIHCVYLNDFRIAGGKPWGGGDVVKEFRVKRADVFRALHMPDPRHRSSGVIS